jgi:hypothetical protein
MSFAAAVLALLSPWTAASPFSASLSLWVAKFLAPLLGGIGTIGLTNVSPLVIILPLLGGAIFALPFLGLRQIWKNQRLNPHSYAAALGIFLVALGEILTFVLTKSVSWDPWQVIELALVVVFGLLLIRCGIAIVRAPRDQSALIRPLGWIMLVTGVCFSSFVLLPVGVIGLAVLYFMFGVVFLRLPRLSQ